MSYWVNHSIFYHIYPLGLCGAPETNKLGEEPVQRLEKLYEWLDPIQELGAAALYLGPIFESTKHGYDTADYFRIDRRLGTNDGFRAFSEEIHNRGMKLVLDGVFNHIGRNFWAFCDLQKNGRASSYVDWFVNVDFTRRSPLGDGFDYANWEGDYSLPKLNLHHPDVRKHLFDAVLLWMRDFQIDGLRLDAADCVDDSFWKELNQITKQEKPDFWLMGEIIHGDYRRWANPQMFDSVTNYEVYKGLWSSLNEGNYFEIAYALTRQFGSGGVYKNIPLYNFADNHDVNRIASQIINPAHLNPLYLLLFTMPGIPSIYYGSEFGVKGKKEDGDAALRAGYSVEELLAQNSPLRQSIQKFIRVRNHSKALQRGNYCELLVKDRQFAFLRQSEDEKIIVLLNTENNEVQLKVPLHMFDDGRGKDLLNFGEEFKIENGELICTVPPNWGRVLRVEKE
ncbi:MAG: alpha-glucosidase C-terminal domain-containing protein [Anaerolineaceae bacterium]|nr:alpha-glucosidase C-terminal domain-containing protein [Anaerolineaceae bacterium]